ncbi:putative alkaline shock family protein YloU [Desulfitispora alkaliphila]|uniref:Asp23/Gls24 family envelope stress response protein n=1 Tax=Desulfitispora alkaliphila TaxID=622674 RepID=UPI003D1EAD0F
MKSIQTNELGHINVSESVIAMIAGHATVQCYGIVGMSSRKLKDGFAELLGREALAKGIYVNTSDDSLTIEVHIIVSYGTKISEVAQNVMDRVKYDVEAMTGVTVEAVNVLVQGVRVTE